jgi:protein farnesyltransferase subunit beta
MTLVSLLNLPLELPPDSPARVAGFETFADGVGEWISRCQTYEGGIGGYPKNEAHGSYTFCGIACLCILGSPSETIPK